MGNLSLKEVAEILCKKDVRSIKSYIEEGLIPSIEINKEHYVVPEELANKLGVENFDEKFIDANGATEFLGENQLTAAFCEAKQIPFYRLKNAKGFALLFRKSELEIYKNRINQLTLEYVPVLLENIHRDNLLRDAWHIIKELLFSVPDRHAEIYGLFLQGMDIEKISIKFNLTKERTRQIIEKSTTKLSLLAVKFSKIVRFYLEGDLSIDEISDFIRSYPNKIFEINQKEKSLLLLKEELVNFLGKEIDSTFTAEKVNSILKKKISEFDLSVRTLGCLLAAEVETLEDLCSFNKNDILKFRNFGKKSLTELECLLKENNLSFGMTFDQVNRKTQEILAKTSISDLIKKAGYVKIDDEETLRSHGYVKI